AGGRGLAKALRSKVGDAKSLSASVNISESAPTDTAVSVELRATCSDTDAGNYDAVGDSVAAEVDDLVSVAFSVEESEEVRLHSERQRQAMLRKQQRQQQHHQSALAQSQSLHQQLEVQSVRGRDALDQMVA
ncbi:MAG: hypothetical protein ACK55I_28110, partial [bacterium]